MRTGCRNVAPVLARIVAAAVSVFLVGGCLSRQNDSAGKWTPHADWIFTGGQVVIVDEGFTIAQAIAVKDGRVIAVGSDADVARHRGGATQIVNIKGRTVVPGLQDSHIHFLNLGRNIHEQADLTLAMSASDIVNAVAEVRQRRNLPPGEWLVG
jgi:predicted amidohydrolase YtcJ